jgi:hypothetical protein
MSTGALLLLARFVRPVSAIGGAFEIIAFVTTFCRKHSTRGPFELPAPHIRAIRMISRFGLLRRG